MTCAETRPLLSEVAGGELAGGEHDDARVAEVRAHAAACVACAAELRDLEATVALCRAAGSEPLPDGFAASLHQALVAAGPPARGLFDRVRAAIARRPLAFAGTSAAFAAALAVAATLALTRPPHAPAPTLAAAPPLPAAYQVPQSKVALVKIDFVAERAVDDVSFEITLPDGLRFVSGGEQLAERSFRFQGRLAAGSNPIPVVVKGPRAGRYRVIAHAIGAALDVTHEVVLEVTT